MKPRELLITDIAQLPFDLKYHYNILKNSIEGMSWGINTPSIYKDTVLVFKVQGFLHRGYVYISLDVSDTFTVTLTKSNRTTIVKQITNVYIEDLINTIDEYVEKNCNEDSYKKMIHNNCSLAGLMGE